MGGVELVGMGKGGSGKRKGDTYVYLLCYYDYMYV